jgi:hypothetical protein
MELLGHLVEILQQQGVAWVEPEPNQQGYLLVGILVHPLL